MINMIDVRICIYFTSSHHPTFPFYKSYLHREHKAGTTESPGDAFYHDGKRPVNLSWFFPAGRMLENSCYGVQPEDEALQRNELDGGTALKVELFWRMVRMSLCNPKSTTLATNCKFIYLHLAMLSAHYASLNVDVGFHILPLDENR